MENPEKKSVWDLRAMLAKLFSTIGRSKRTGLALLCAIGAAVLLLLISAGVFRGGGENANAAGAQPEPNADTALSDAEKLEERLEAILGEISGVGSVRVMITLKEIGSPRENGSRSFGGYQANGLFTADNGSKQSETAAADVRGVVVVAQGAENIAVRLNIIAAVSTVLGVDEKCVEVFKMG